jgi:hypothetical protein
MAWLWLSQLKDEYLDLMNDWSTAELRSRVI